MTTRSVALWQGSSNDEEDDEMDGFGNGPSHISNFYFSFGCQKASYEITAILHWNYQKKIIGKWSKTGKRMTLKATFVPRKRSIRALVCCIGTFWTTFLALGTTAFQPLSVVVTTDKQSWSRFPRQGYVVQTVIVGEPVLLFGGKSFESLWSSCIFIKVGVYPLMGLGCPFFFLIIDFFSISSWTVTAQLYHPRLSLVKQYH